jgi:hypothetical protein
MVTEQTPNLQSLCQWIFRADLFNLDARKHLCPFYPHVFAIPREIPGGFADSKITTGAFGGECLQGDIKVESPTLCGARWHLAAGCQPTCHKHRKADYQSAARCHLAPHSPSGLAYTYAQISAVLPQNRAGPHFHVPHPRSHQIASTQLPPREIGDADVVRSIAR